MESTSTASSEDAARLQQQIVAHAIGKDGVSQKVLRFWLLIANQPNISVEDAAQQLEVDIRTIRRYEKELMERGFIEVGRFRGKDGMRLHRLLHFPNKL